MNILNAIRSKTPSVKQKYLEEQLSQPADTESLSTDQIGSLGWPASMFFSHSYVTSRGLRVSESILAINLSILKAAFSWGRR